MSHILYSPIYNNLPSGVFLSNIFHSFEKKFKILNGLPLCNLSFPHHLKQQHLKTTICHGPRFPFSLLSVAYSGVTLRLHFSVRCVPPDTIWMFWYNRLLELEIIRYKGNHGPRLSSRRAGNLAAIVTARRRRLSHTVQKYHTHRERKTEYVPCYQTPERVSFVI